ncbi:GNAT family N-acetyltransferase [Glycomyces sp. YM15]|uniref:GNAT family N-acetyltransferase n=1 Tax=Glycomyces sp. YM15 TaxID=2800446 RepID=UPI001963DBA4|nr:GNAT family N-acetyltransferase [Glycomyces sp. YM15]
MRIRPLHRDDADAAGELLRRLGYPQSGTTATAARIQAWSEDPSSTALAADLEGHVLGLIAVHVCPSFERTGSWARIVALVVADEARGRGVGGRLMEAAEAFAAARDCRAMEVTSSDHREAAHAFYRNRGYMIQTGRSSRFLRGLGDG